MFLTSLSDAGIKQPSHWLKSYLPFLLIAVAISFCLYNEYSNKMKNKKYNTVGTILNSNIKIAETGKTDTLNKEMHDRSLS